MVDKTVDLLSQEMDHTSQPGQGEAAHHSHSSARDSIERNETTYIDGPVLATPNNEPHRRRISNPTHGLKRVAQLIKRKITPPPTAEQIAKMDEKQRLKLLKKTLIEESKVASRRISRALSDLGYAYHRKDPAGNITRSRYIVFDAIYGTEDAIWLHVDMRHWPHGVNSDSIIEQSVVNHLSRSVGHKVNVKATPEAGIWFIIERASGMMGIPVHVPINEMWAKFPSTAGNLTLPLGMTNNRKPVFDDLDEMVHVMVAGQTGGGKSTLLNVIICTLITRNSPAQLQILLLDMKAGLEFQFFENLPHLLKIPDIAPTGIISDPDFVAPALRWIVSKEAKSRLDKIRAAGHKDIKNYNNNHRKEKLPRIVVIVDEWAIARMGEGGKDSEFELAKGLQLLRAAGIHFIICTQTPNKDVLGVLARGNLTTRVAFSCSDLSASILICGNGDALNLSPAGRCIYKRGHQQPVQVPWISEQAVKEVVAGVMDGKYKDALTTQKHDVTIDEIYEWAIHENMGSLRVTEVYSHFSHRGITREEILKTLQTVENTVVSVLGKSYLVLPGAGTRPRKLVAQEDGGKEA